MAVPKYPFEIQPLTAEEGGGYLITFPDLPGCMSDGETIEAAIGNGADAETAWLRLPRSGAIPFPSRGKARAANLCSACLRVYMRAWWPGPGKKASA